MKKLITIFLICAGLANAQQSVTVLNNGAGTGTFNTPGVTYYLAGPAGGTWDFSNVTTKGITGGGGGSVSQIVAGTNVTISPVGGTGVVTINSSAGGGTPGGPFTSIQFNNSGVFGGSSDLEWNGSSLVVTYGVAGVLDGMAVQNTNTGTASQAELAAVNNGGFSMLMGINGTGYTGTFLGVTGPASFLYSNGNYPLILGTNSLPDLTFAASGSATFNYAVTVVGLLTLDSGFALPLDTYNGVLNTTTTGAVVSVKGPINVMAGYGVDNTGATDTTVAIQAVITAARSSGQAIYFPKGTYQISELNVTAFNNLVIRGDGPTLTIFEGNSSTAKSVLDFSNSNGVTLSDFQVATKSPATPKTGILILVSTGLTANAFTLDRISVSGAFTVGDIYNYGAVSSKVGDCQFTDNYTGGAVAPLYFTSTNAGSMTSDYITVASGTQQVSDWTFVDCETHDQSNFATSTSMILDSLQGFRWYGGNISCNNSGSNENQQIVTEGPMAGIIFSGPTIYADSGNQLPYAFYFKSTNTGSVSNFAVGPCVVYNSTAVFETDAITIENLAYSGQTQTGIIGGGNAATITNSYLVCDGGTINIGTGSITGSILIQPGTVTATTNACIEGTTAGMTDTGTLTVTGTSQLSSNTGIFTGPAGTVDLYDSHALTGSTGAIAQYGARFDITGNETSTANSHTQAITPIRAIGLVGASNAANWTGNPGVVGGLFQTQVVAGATGTISMAQALNVKAMGNGASGATVTSAMGIQVVNSTNSGTFTNLAGIDVASQTVATNNTDLELGSTTISSGNFGIDQEDTYQDKLGGKITTYNNVATAGIGVTPVVSTPRSSAVTNSTTSLAAYTVPASDSSFEVSANVNVTAATTAAMTVTCTYTDETNTSRTLTLGFTQLSGATLLTSITNVTGTGPYESPCYHIRCKASTTITFATTGTVTGITYNIEGTAVQLQ